MNKNLIARLWFGAIALQVFLVMPTRLVLSWNDQYGEFSEPCARSVNVLCYFTNQSNILVGVVCLLLAINLNRKSKLFDVAKFSGLICIVVAGTVYYLLLASEDNLEGLAAVNNFIVHASVPVMYFLGWLVFVKHGSTNWKVVRLSLIFPVGWAAFALIRGAIIDFYPYPFMDVNYLGYIPALINMVFVTLFFVALFVGAHLLDRKLVQTDSKT